jgi:hypothetical protein
VDSVALKAFARHTILAMGVVAVEQSVLLEEVTVKSEVLVAAVVFELTVTEILPVVAPVGTVVVNWVVVAAVTVATVPLKDIVLLLGVVLKFVPVTITVAPITPLEGEKEVIEGGFVVAVVTVKSVAEVTEFEFTVTEILPVVAPDGTTTVSWLVVAAETEAFVPLNVTLLPEAVVLKLVPEIKTVEPTTPLLGVKLVIVGVRTSLSVL